MRLRPGVEFHNGKTLDADDLIFTVNRILDPSAPTLIAGSLQFMGINRLRTEDDRTVRFIFDRPFAPFLDALFTHMPGSCRWTSTQAIPSARAPSSTELHVS